jgi:hypothetical protein
MSYKTSKQKTAALAMVGVVVAAALVAAVSFAPIAASAQERPSGEDVRMHRLRTASGSGIATDVNTGDDFRSAFRAIWHYDNSTDERTMSRGTIVISVDEERITYTMLPETWEIEVAEDGLTFEANGQVQNSDSEVFDVSLNGYLGGPVGFIKRIGTTWSVDGVMMGEDREYELHYVVIAHLGRPAVIEE